MIALDRGYLALGVMIGAILCLFGLLYLGFFEFLKISSDLVAAFIGAVLGGSIALWGQLISIQATQQERTIRTYEEQTARAQSIFLKMQSFYSHVQKLHNHYRTYDASSQIFINGSPALIKPLQGNNIQLDLNIEEKSFLLSQKNVSLFNKMSDLEGISSNLFLLSSYYLTKLTVFQQRQVSSGKVKVLDGVVRSEGEPDVYNLIELKDILHHILETLRVGLPLCENAMAEILKIVSEFGLKIELDTVSDISGAADYKTRQY